MKNKNKMVANDLPHNKYNCKYDIEWSWIIDICYNTTNFTKTTNYHAKNQTI